MNKSATPVSFKEAMIGLIKLMRPKQWVKNGFVLAPLLFTGELLNASAVWQTVLAVLFFCIASSATYIVNDLHDIELDRRHPKKSKSRPLASGIVTPRAAIVLLALLYFVLLMGFYLMPKVLLVIAAYLVLNLAYTFFLKHQPVIDIFTIAIGFVLRVIAGSMALGVDASAWMCVTTLCLALYLAAIKRRQELANSGADGRTVLKSYTVKLVDRYAEMSATGALLFLQHVCHVNKASACDNHSLGSIRLI
jgi:4-hydroxybenzoate polyprenyltransferase